MDIKELKSKIENKSIGQEGMIFVSKNTFIPRQYISEIAKIYDKTVEYVDSYIKLFPSKSMFSIDNDNSIFVFITDELQEKVDLDNFCYIICNKCKNKDAIVIPNLESWHMLDYAISNSSSNLDKEKLREVVSACNGDMYLLDNEISKYNIFESNQKYIFNSLYDNNQLVKSYKETIFDFTNAILDKDISKICYFYINLDKYNFDAMALVSILYTQIRNIILVGFNNNPTEANTGLSSKQIYWIRKNLYKYNRDQLLRLFLFISSADMYLKEGILSSKQLFDFVVINFLQELL